MAELITTKKLFEKIPAEKCWELTAKILTRLSVLRGSKSMPLVLGKEEGIISPVWGWEKWQEILLKVYTEINKRLLIFSKETSNISLEDAIDAAKLAMIAFILLSGPELEGEIVEATPEKATVRFTKCSWGERFKEFEVDPALRGACTVHEEVWDQEGFKAINPKITFRLTKSMHRGDPYCEGVYEFKEE